VKTYIFDIDGTVADLEHRLHFAKVKPKNYRKFFQLAPLDTPIQPIIDIAKTLSTTHKIVYCTGRSEEIRDVTIKWLKDFGLPNDGLYMRPIGDNSPDYILKIELLKLIRADGFDPVAAFDDRSRVVDAWRKAGIPCLQVAPGDY